MHSLLDAEFSMYYKLPEWTKQYYPNGKLSDAAELFYEILSYNERLKQLNGGTF